MSLQKRAKKLILVLAIFTSMTAGRKKSDENNNYLRTNFIGIPCI